MSHFLELKPSEQKELIVATAEALGMPATIVEKDFWVCWILDLLFQLPEHMVFKGGTSLSKAFQVIERFSEDLDVTIDYRNFHDEIDLEKTSKSQIKKFSDQLKIELQSYIADKALPYLTQQVQEKLSPRSFEVKLNKNGEQIEFYYKSLVTKSHVYLRDHVLIEFGMRNSIEPFAKQNISPYLSTILQQHSLNIDLPHPHIDTLSPARTFWEKATLIHVECHRGRLTSSPERLSRHWYDLYKLIHHSIGQVALNDINLLKDVITFKKAFFNASYANYEDCLNKQFRLIPDASNLTGLEKDYHAMIDSGMFYKTPPKFDDIIETLKKLEAEMNEI